MSEGDHNGHERLTAAQLREEKATLERRAAALEQEIQEQLAEDLDILRDNLVEDLKDLGVTLQDFVQRTLGLGVSRARAKMSELAGDGDGAVKVTRKKVKLRFKGDPSITYGGAGRKPEVIRSMMSAEGLDPDSKEDWASWKDQNMEPISEAA